MREISVGITGLIALVDDEDYNLVIQYSWHKYLWHNDVVYARRRWYQEGVRKQERMHTLITGWNIVDHKDHNGLNNQKSNLRRVTTQENNWNRQPTGKGSSRFKGVSLIRPSLKWSATITRDYKTHRLGVFNDEIEAAKAYDKAALELFGEFACLNFPRKKISS